MEQDLLDLVQDVRLPDGDAARAVSRPDLQDWAWESGLSLREAEIHVLQEDIWPLPYLRNRKRFSTQDQIRLLSSRVLLAGLGGLGGVILEILARAGVGMIRALDPDAFEESNLNRQLLATSENLDGDKAVAAMERMEVVNPALELEAAKAALTAENADQAFAEVDVAADGLGDVEGRKLLWRLARKAHRPVASAAVAGQAGFVATVLPDGPDPSAILAAAGGAGAETSLGTQGPAIHTAAGIECSEILALLLGRRPALAGKVLLFDLGQASFETLKL